MATQVGILGGGQLAAMLIESCAGVPDVSVALWCDADDEATRFHPNRSISGLAGEALATWAAGCSVVTFEHEHVDIDKLPRESLVTYRPGVRALRVSQDRALEKREFEALGIPVAPWILLPGTEDEAHGLFPGIVKTANHGYDGKGQSSVSSLEEVRAALKTYNRRCVLEKRVSFAREVSQVSVRDLAGNVHHYPLVHNEHRGGILSATFADLEADDAKPAALAREYTERLAKAMDYVGTLAVEFFVVEGGLLANEWAPRVHNSGHWSIEGAVTSQFENHMRAIIGNPIGRCDRKHETTMWNLIGISEERAREFFSAIKREFPTTAAFLHWYGKSAKPARKVGHITVLEPRDSAANRKLGARRAEIQQL
jgi:5-(carboxyamino)imidazole ribonucleotide synthase